MDKSKLGTRFTCFECGTKFYDLNRPDPVCPNCGADQRNAPAKDVKDILKSGKGRRRAKPVTPEEVEPELTDDDLGDDDLDDDDELFDDDDDDGDDD